MQCQYPDVKQNDKNHTAPVVKSFRLPKQSTIRHHKATGISEAREVAPFHSFESSILTSILRDDQMHGRSNQFSVFYHKIHCMIHFFISARKNFHCSLRWKTTILPAPVRKIENMVVCLDDFVEWVQYTLNYIKHIKWFNTTASTRQRGIS